MLRIDGIVFDPPSGFEPSETMITLTTTPPASAEAPAAGAPRGPRTVRPNLIIQNRAARPGAEIGILAGEYMAELSQSVGGLKDLTSLPFGFDDGTSGVLLAYDFPMPAVGAAHSSKGGSPPKGGGGGGPGASAGAGAGSGAAGAGPGGIPAGSVMRQYHVLRLDEGRLTTMTLTVGTADLTPALGESYLKSLASAKRVESNPKKGAAKKT